MKRIVLASGNPDKLSELRYLLRDLEIEIIPVRDLIPEWSVEETGSSLEENAFLKARDAAEKTSLPAIADDTGLFVDVLGGAPGIYAARFAGIDCSYDNNIKKLLRTMLCEENRKAAFITSAVLVSPEVELSVLGEITGTIIEEPDGEDGFGYDPIFLPDELDRTFARCSAEEKHRISHRARAMRKLRERLLKLR
ncbi:non-canonical purine NTP pyrophosphatase, RdgB/HAM1 family [Candidatus Fermentibacteria bacterium]|nr:MAG: non-canonical purine NTP pyrophosphatase, RdgB/HAM1 family [Candidatus Fermentibacteria bacterium]